MSFDLDNHPLSLILGWVLLDTYWLMVFDMLYVIPDDSSYYWLKTITDRYFTTEGVAPLLSRCRCRQFHCHLKQRWLPNLILTKAKTSRFFG